MAKLWAGRLNDDTSAAADDFNSSIRIDSRMYKQDIEGSMAHAAMLGAKGIIPAADADSIIEALSDILADIDKGTLAIDPACEDIHMFVEAELTRRIGEAGKRLHTARSRNDQVALDVRLYLREETREIIELVKGAMRALLCQARQNVNTIMPGYTHLQRAQPVTFAQHMLAYCMMLSRDIGRLNDAASRMDQSPLGACALAGTTYDIDRRMTAASLGFQAPTLNSLDSVSDRDFCIELLSAFAVIMMHLSRLSEELILWSSWEFKFIELSDAFSTGSSIMPQKKNPDMAELIRGKTGRVYGDLMAMLTVMKGLPLSYNKDMQEDKEAVFDAIDTVKQVFSVLTPMIDTMKALPSNMRSAAAKGFINATDLADYLVKRGMAFRDAYKLTGELVAYCMHIGATLETLPLAEYKQRSEVFDSDLYDEIRLETCVEKRISEGGTGNASVMAQIDYIAEYLQNV